jgi:hypothetical protein
MSRLNILNRSSRDNILESTSDIREIESEGVTETVGMEDTTFGVNDSGGCAQLGSSEAAGRKVDTESVSWYNEV